MKAEIVNAVDQYNKAQQARKDADYEAGRLPGETFRAASDRTYAAIRQAKEQLVSILVADGYSTSMRTASGKGVLANCKVYTKPRGGFVEIWDTFASIIGATTAAKGARTRAIKAHVARQEAAY